MTRTPPTRNPPSAPDRMSLRAKLNVKRLPAVLASCCLLGGCAFGPLASSTHGNGVAANGVAAGSIETIGSDEQRSTSCEGLAVERQVRTARIAALRPQMAVELENSPTTLMQALQRVSTTPEVGTNAHAQIAADQAGLDAAAALAARKGCPAATLAPKS